MYTATQQNWKICMFRCGASPTTTGWPSLCWCGPASSGWCVIAAAMPWCRPRSWPSTAPSWWCWVSWAACDSAGPSCIPVCLLLWSLTLTWTATTLPRASTWWQRWERRRAQAKARHFWRLKRSAVCSAGLLHLQLLADVPSAAGGEKGRAVAEGGIPRWSQSRHM